MNNDHLRMNISTNGDFMVASPEGARVYTVKYWVCDNNEVETFYVGSVSSPTLDLVGIQETLSGYTRRADEELREEWDEADGLDWSTEIGNKLFSMISQDNLLTLVIDWSQNYPASDKFTGDIEISCY